MTDAQPTFIYTIDIPVRWYDMDAFGHVNNSVYFTYFEQARASWWDTIRPEGITYRDVGPVIVNAFCTFRRAIIHPETVRVKLFVSPPSRSSYEHHYEIISADNPDIIYATGSTKVVWVDRNKVKSTRLPEWIIQQLPTS